MLSINNQNTHKLISILESQAQFECYKNQVLITGDGVLNSSDLIVALRRFFPGQSFRAKRLWMGYVLETKTQLPQIGIKEGIIFAKGFAGLGWIHGFYSGKILADYFEGKKIPDYYSKPL